MKGFSLGPVRIAPLLSAIFLGSLVLWGFWPWITPGSERAAPRTIVFYGFSILAETFERSIFPEFSREWKA